MVYVTKVIQGMQCKHKYIRWKGIQLHSCSLLALLHFDITSVLDVACHNIKVVDFYRYLMLNILDAKKRSGSLGMRLSVPQMGVSGHVGDQNMLLAV